LELAKRPISVRSEHPIDTTRIESETVQLLLQLSNVVTGDQVSGGIRDDSIAEIPSGLLKSAEGTDVNDPVDVGTANLLECANGGIDVIVKDVAFAPANAEKPEALKAIPDFGDCWVANSARKVKRGEFDRRLHNHRD